MKNRRCWFICTIAIVALYGFSASADEPPIPDKVKSDLIGRPHPALKGIRVVVFTLNHSGSEPNEPTLWNTVTGKVTRRLSGAGIGWVKPRPGSAGPVDMPVFTIAVDTLKPADSQQYVFYVQTSLATDVCLKDNSSMCLKAELWKMASPIRAVPAKELAAAITKEITRQTEAFTLAHSAANQYGVSEPAVPSKAVGERAARQRRQIPAEYLYVASRKSKVFHKPDCGWAKRISPENLVGFATRDDAVKTGRRPCRRCNP